MAHSSSLRCHCLEEDSLLGRCCSQWNKLWDVSAPSIWVCCNGGGDGLFRCFRVCGWRWRARQVIPDDRENGEPSWLNPRCPPQRHHLPLFPPPSPLVQNWQTGRQTKRFYHALFQWGPSYPTRIVTSHFLQDMKGKMGKIQKYCSYINVNFCQK